jgi:hypothetical protein
MTEKILNNYEIDFKQMWHSIIFLYFTLKIENKDK